MKILYFAILVLLCSCSQEADANYKLGDEAPQLEIYHENTAADLKEKQENY